MLIEKQAAFKDNWFLSHRSICLRSPRRPQHSAFSIVISAFLDPFIYVSCCVVVVTTPRLPSALDFSYSVEDLCYSFFSFWLQAIQHVGAGISNALCHGSYLYLWIFASLRLHSDSVSLSTSIMSFSILGLHLSGNARHFDSFFISPGFLSCSY